MANFVIFKNEYDSYEDLKNVLNYVDDQTRFGGYIGGQNILLGNPMEQAMAVNRFFYNETKRKAFHFTLAFEDDDLMIFESKDCWGNLGYFHLKFE